MIINSMTTKTDRVGEIIKKSESINTPADVTLLLVPKYLALIYDYTQYIDNKV